MARLAFRIRLVALGFLVASSVGAQSPPPRSIVVNDPDVQGAQRLFSAWLEGQPVGEVVRFVEEGGRVVRMITGDSYVDRVKE